MPQENLFFIIGVIWFLNFTWRIQVNFGNYLKHTHPKSWLRKLWWSMCDVDGICDLCDSHVDKNSLWDRGLNFKDLWKKSKRQK